MSRPALPASAWFIDALALAVASAQRTGLMYADPVDARRAEALHLLGAVQGLLLDERIRTRSEEATAIVDALRRRREAEADGRIVAGGFHAPR